MRLEIFDRAGFPAAGEVQGQNSRASQCSHHAAASFLLALECRPTVSLPIGDILPLRFDIVGRRAQRSVGGRSEEHTSELQSLMRNSYAVFCLKKKKNKNDTKTPEAVCLSERMDSGNTEHKEE